MRKSANVIVAQAGPIDVGDGRQHKHAVAALRGGEWKQQDRYITYTLRQPRNCRSYCSRVTGSFSTEYA
jgi:hypothetical protein